MKKLLMLAVLGAMSAGTAFAQSLQVTGHIKNENGDAVPSALIQVSDTKASTYTDSTGYFVLPTAATAKLTVVAKGYQDEIVSPQKELTVVLKKGRSSETGLKLNDPNASKAYNNNSNVTKGFSYFQLGGTDRNAGGGGMVFSVHHKENTQGSRYLVEDWAAGSVIEQNGHVVNTDQYAYNYDKIGGNLLLTQDKRAAVEIDKHQIKSFTIFNKSIPQTFEIVPAIDSMHFTQQLSAGANYTLYKYTKTKFVKSDYRTDGMTSSGNNYDEYVDQPTYYIKNLKTGELQKVALKAKAIKQALAGESTKVNAYFTDHQDDDINEQFLAGLTGSLN